MRFKSSLGKNSKFGSREDEDFGLSLTPLVDVVFLLLIFFMVSTAFVDFSKKMGIELPESKSSETLKEVNNILIEMPLGGKVYVDGKETTFDSLGGDLMALALKDKKNNVLIRADKKLPYGEVIKVMGICREAEFHDIGVAVK